MYRPLNRHSPFQVWIVEVPEEVLPPVTNVFVMNKEKWMENLCSVADQEETAGETASGNPVEALAECVFENKVLITLKGLLFIIMWSSQLQVMVIQQRSLVSTLG